MDERSQQKNSPGYYKGLGRKTRSEREKHFKQQSKMHWDDPDAYKELPGDTKGKKLQKTSKHTKKYHELFGESEDFLWEIEDEHELFEADDDDKASTDQGPIDNDAVETGLAKKKKESS